MDTNFIMGLVYIVILIIDLPVSYPDNRIKSEDQASIKQIISIIAHDRPLFWHLLSGICFLMGLIQIESSIPLLLNQENIIHIYAMLQAENAILVILLSVPIMKLVSTQSPRRIIFLISLFSGLGLVCFTFHWLPLYFIGIALSTVGEIVFIPIWREKITSLGGELRGTYLGITNFGDFGLFLGSTLGGFLFKNGG